MSLRLDDTGFGQLQIYQNPKEFCYGVDAVLLADFAANNCKKKSQNHRLIDLGMGTGIVPLLLSYMTDAGYIAGVEVQESSWQLAMMNREYNGLEDRLEFFLADVKNGLPKSLTGTFDVVTSNPPYTAGSRGIESSNRAKAIARHETTASLDDFIKCASQLLSDKGEFFMVHRPARLVDICESCRNHKLEPKQMRFVSGRPGEKPNILLVHCVKNGNRELRIMKPLFVHNVDESYSTEIKGIYHKL